MQPPSINSSVSALRFFFTVTLDRPDLSRRLTVNCSTKSIANVLTSPTTRSMSGADTRSSMYRQERHLGAHRG
jgi:hypothetical protein